MRREAISSPSDARIIGFKLRRGAVMCVTTRDGSGGKSCRVFAPDPMGETKNRTTSLACVSMKIPMINF